MSNECSTCCDSLFRPLTFRQQFSYFINIYAIRSFPPGATTRSHSHSPPINRGKKCRMSRVKYLERRHRVELCSNNNIVIVNLLGHPVIFHPPNNLHDAPGRTIGKIFNGRGWNPTRDNRVGPQISLGWGYDLRSQNIDDGDIEFSDASPLALYPRVWEWTFIDRYFLQVNSVLADNFILFGTKRRTRFDGFGFSFKQKLIVVWYSS